MSCIITVRMNGDDRGENKEKEKEMRGKTKALVFLLLVVFAVASVWAEGQQEEG